VPLHLEKKIDCVVIGGGPAGLTAALYLARYNRNCLLVDSGASRAAWIPATHNLPMFARITGPEILALQRAQACNYGAILVSGTVTDLKKTGRGFTVRISSPGGGQELQSRNVIIATGAADIPPAIPDIAGAVERGLIRYCPVCDGYEAANKKVAVIGLGDRGLPEAVFIARTYTPDVTLLTVGHAMKLGKTQWDQIRQHNIQVVTEPVESLRSQNGHIAAITAAGETEMRFEVVYSALGLVCRSELAAALGAVRGESGALVVDGHNRTSVPGLYAAGDVVEGLSQIVVAMGHAAVAATDVHNRCLE
jgi:thioredoxin reductase (NADPH)